MPICISVSAQTDTIVPVPSSIRHSSFGVERAVHEQEVVAEEVVRVHDLDVLEELPHHDLVGVLRHPRPEFARERELAHDLGEPA